jgi:hypothetical protein
MTFEHKTVVGLDDIKAVTFECNVCKTRTTVPTENLKEAPHACNSCNTVWWNAQDIRMGAFVTTSGPAIVALIQAIITMRVLMGENKNNFKILFEFEEPND